ncbi:MAG: precorrin-2 C(20)-methyltransferase [Carbonactinosporaceae bacterium]
MRRLVGVGVGPGDPELVTVKALRILREADVVLVPVLAAGEHGHAEATVRAHIDHDRVHRVVFALDDPGGVTARREAAWDAAAERVLAAYHDGAATVVFATIGDPSIYSTFTYLAQSVQERVPDLHVDTVPGVTAMQDLAARSGTVLCEGTETLALFPLTAGVARFRAALRDFDTVVVYKGSRRTPEMLAAIEEAGRLDLAVYGANLGLAGEDIRPAVAASGPGAYLSTLIVPARRTRRGGRLGG